MADGGGWKQVIAAPPVGQGQDVGQVGAPLLVQLQAAAGHALVVATSGPIAVQVAYEGGGDGQLSPRLWLDVGTWALVLPAALLRVRLSPPLAGVPEASLWIDTTPPRRPC